MDLVGAIYKLRRILPDDEKYGLSSQMKRAAVSILSNIAEGKARGSRKEYRQFMLNAYGSGAELETQIEIMNRLQLAKTAELDSVNCLLAEVMKMLNVIIKKLKG